ncbi:MAG: SHD1 domain-containing protein [Thermoguttaceae bacterium]
MQIKTFQLSRSQDKLFVVSLEITNLSPTKIVNYKGWGAKELDLNGEDRASLKDDTDNDYKRCHFGLGSRIVGQVSENESIYPNKNINDLVVFEPPTDACKFVLLQLPASGFGGEGMLRIRIPRSMWDETIITRQRAKAQAEARRKAADERRQADEKKQKAAEQARWHTWKTADGKFSARAKFVKMAGNTVYLEKEDGRQIKISKDRLSKDDQKWIVNKGWNNPLE